MFAFISEWIHLVKQLCSLKCKCDFPYYSTSSTSLNYDGEMCRCSVPDLTDRFNTGLKSSALCPLLFVPRWASVFTEKRGFGASGSSGDLIIHGLSLRIVAHSHAAVTEIIYSANPSQRLCHLSQRQLNVSH